MGRNDRSRSRSPSPSSKRRRHSHRSSSRRSDRDRSYDRSKEHDRSRERDRKKGKSRDKHRRNKSKERSRERSHKERRDASPERSRDRSHRDKRDRSTERSRDRSRDGSKSRRHRSSRHSHSEKSRTKSKERSRSPDSSSDSTEVPTSETKTHTELPTVVEEKTEPSTDQSDEIKRMMLEQEEKVRQRRERVEQWRKEREAKQATEEDGTAQSSATLESQQESKKWSLEDEDDDDEEEDGAGVGDDDEKKGDEMNVDDNAEETKQDKVDTPVKEAEAAVADKEEEDDEIDPLDAFMMDVTAEVQKLSKEDQKKARMVNSKHSQKVDFFSQNNNDSSDGESSGSEPEDILALAAKKMKKKDIAAVDHSQVSYEPFRKDFYIEPPELADMTPEQVDILRVELDGIKIRGVNCPKPIKKWTHCGLPVGCHEIIKKLKFDAPTPIQAQAMPAIMSGRDVIGVAKTGSGKTIAFLLPMFRHIKDQRPLEPMEGPIAVIMTPTRELAVQIHKECKHFLKALNLRAVCAYGGSPIKDQIADLKRGAEIVVCTPGRMIDLLSANSGRVTNLRRATYLVLDEADRMFDMGFEPQVMKIVNNVRPSRQTVLFSATFPRQMEALARKILKKPLEITVGGRSVVCEDVTQIVEVREDSTKFLRLLEILGQYYRDDSDLR
ncbi:pre-mRNA processing RNA-helicase, partial [Basidiobolus ranarum]